MNMAGVSGAGAPMLGTVVVTVPVGFWRSTSAPRLPWLRRFTTGATVSRGPTMSQQYSIPSIYEISLARYWGAAVKSRMTRTLTIFLRTLTDFFRSRPRCLTCSLFAILCFRRWKSVILSRITLRHSYYITFTFCTIYSLFDCDTIRTIPFFPCLTILMTTHEGRSCRIVETEVFEYHALLHFLRIGL